eukprot:283791_1
MATHGGAGGRASKSPSSSELGAIPKVPSFDTEFGDRGKKGGHPKETQLRAVQAAIRLQIQASGDTGGARRSYNKRDGFGHPDGPERLLKQLRDVVQRVSSQLTRSPQSLFAQFDGDANGQLDLMEFQFFVETMGLEDESAEEINSLFRFVLNTSEEEEAYDQA